MWIQLIELLNAQTQMVSLVSEQLSSSNFLNREKYSLKFVLLIPCIFEKIQGKHSNHTIHNWDTVCLPHMLQQAS